MTNLCLTWDRQLHLCLSHYSKTGCSRYLIDADESKYDLDAEEVIHCVAVHEALYSCPHRILVIMIDGVDHHEWHVPDNYTRFWWNIKWLSTPPECTVRFEVRNAITNEKVMGRTAWINTPDEPLPEPPEDDVSESFNWVVLTLSSEIGAAKDSIINAVVDPTNAINNVKASISALSGSVIGAKDTIIRDSLNRFDELKSYISDLNIPSLDSIEGVLDPVKEQIAGIEIPTIDNIKEGFLSLTVEFAESLWDRILDKIEERYNK